MDNLRLILSPLRYESGKAERMGIIRCAAGIPTSFVSLKNLSNSFQCFKDWKEFNVI